MPLDEAFADVTNQVHILKDMILFNMRGFGPYTQGVYRALRTQHNNAFKWLMGLPRHCSASGMLAEAGVASFSSIVRGRIASLLHRVPGSPNCLMQTFAGRLDVDSAIMQHWTHVQLSKDRQLSNVEDEAYKEEDLSFRQRLVTTKAWFSRLSSCNKKQFLLTLLGDIMSGWTLSLILKSIWNCRPKDAVCSVAQPECWSSYDVSPLDHNRGATPWKVLMPAMQADRAWFVTLEPEPQALFMLELLSISGGPVMWAILDRGQKIYEKYKDDQLMELQECPVMMPQKSGKPPSPPNAEKLKKEQRRKDSSSNTEPIEPEKPPVPMGRTEEILKQYLIQWDSVMTSMKASLKLEEMEVTFKDGSKRTIWKVNRPKPEIIETVDFIQLLPSSIAKQILSYVPRVQLPMYVSVNNYWGYLIDELKEEFNIRAKINLDIQKLEGYIIRNEQDNQLSEPDLLVGLLNSQDTIITMTKSSKATSVPQSRKASVKSVGFSLKNMREDKPKRCHLPKIRNMADMSNRLDTRGAADENLVKWCQNVLEQCKNDKMRLPSLIKNPTSQGVIPLQDLHFPTSLMKQTVRLPLVPPLVEDPSVRQNKIKPKPDFATVVMANPKDVEPRPKFDMWSRDLSSLYPACKIASYHCPG